MKLNVKPLCSLVAAIAFIGIVSGCSNSVVNSALGYDVAIKAADKIVPDSIAPLKQVDTINLVCPDSVILGSIKQVYAADDMFVVVDNMFTVHGFKADGSYVCGYGRRGEAPDEYVNMGACAVTPTGHDVVIVDNAAQRMYFYDLHSGEFKHRLELPVGSVDMVQQCVFLSDSVALLARYVYNNKNSVYAVVNFADRTVEDFASVELKTDNIAMPIGWHAIAEYQGKGVYIRPFEPAVYQYPDTKWMYIEQGKKVYDEQQLAEISDFSIATYFNAISKGYFPGYTSVYVLKDWIFLGFLNAEFSLIDKTDQGMTTCKYIKDAESNHMNVGDIVGAIPERNILIGADNGLMSESDQIFMYRLPSR